MVLGISGTYCSGKSEVGRILKSTYGFEEIDVDSVGHEALRRRREAVTAAFGKQILTADGEVDRRTLGSVVFSNAEHLARLESILHPEMVRVVSERVPRSEGRRTLINAALLVHMGLDTLCDSVLRVDAPVIVRMLRARRRDHLGWKEIIARIRRQRHVKFSSEHVDTYTVWNWKGKVWLERRVKALAETLGFAE